MNEYNVTIEVNKLYGSFIEAGSREEAIQKAIDEWSYDFSRIDLDDLQIDCEEFYWEDFE